MARLDRLEGMAEVARISSVIGREFSYELLSAIAGLPQAKLDAGLARLIQSELVFRLGATQHSLYSFKHALVRDAAYSGLLRDRRRQLHARIASVLEAQFADTVEARPELLAHHCAEAGLIRKAVGLCLKAGRQAIARSAMTEAIAQLQKGLELVPALTHDAARLTHELDLQIALGQAVIATKGYAAPDAGKAYARARQLCEELNRPPQFVPVLWGQWVLHLVRAEFEQADRHAGEMLRLGRARNDATLKYLGCRCSGLNRYYFGDFTAARGYLEECLALYDPMHRPFYTELAGEDVHVGTLMHLSRTLARLGYLDQARVLRDDALAQARRLPPFTLVLTLVLVWFADWGIRPTEALLQLADEISAISAEQGFRLWLGAGRLFRGWCVATLGDKTEGIAQLIDGLAAVRATGCNATMPFSLLLLADAYGKAGRPGDGLDRLTEAAQVIEDTHERWEEAELHRVRGELLMIAHQGRAAEESFRKAIDIARRQNAKAWELRATVSLARIRCWQGKRVEAHDLLEPIYGWFTEGFDTPDLKDARAILDAVS
jgi:predicted ATPase